jgi:Flp pilus assembly protein TadG
MKLGWERLWRCCNGVAALEFAIIAPVLLTICGALADFGLALRDQMQLHQAVSNGAGYAFAAQQSLASLGTVSPSAVSSVVSASLTLSNVTVTASAPGPYCVQTNTQSSPPTSSLTAGSYDTACPGGNPGGNPAGTYMTITAQYTFTPMTPAYSQLASTSLSATVIVRLY